MEKQGKKDTPVQYLKGVGPVRAEALIAEGIGTARDLVYYFPTGYIDRTEVLTLKALAAKLRSDSLFEEGFNTQDFKISTETTVIADIKSKSVKKLGSRRTLLILTVSDGTATAHIKFFNMAQFFDKAYKQGDLLAISGKPELNMNMVEFSHPDIAVLDPEESEIFSKGGILPKYRITDKMSKAGFSPRVMRRIAAEAVDAALLEIEESLPEYLLNHLNLVPLQFTLKNLHFPTSKESLVEAINRMKYEEILTFLLTVEMMRSRTKIDENAPVADQKSALARKLFDTLPFDLTPDQKTALRDIAADMATGRPMNRLLQGDVGSGKTIVALLSILMAIDNGLQTAFMAPTEILAEQHYHNIQRFVEPLGLRVGLVVGGRRNKEREQLLQEVASGNVHIVVGTHAMFQGDVEYCNMGLAVIDEQHRFGVEQRAELINRAKKSLGGTLAPHILVMSATPIPRTLTMTVYGDLDLSIIKTKPKNRKPIKTKIAFESTRHEVFDFVKTELRAGRQAYIVFPLVEKSDKLDLKAAAEHHEELGAGEFGGFSLGLLHGQMRWDEKEAVMRDFLEKKYDLLVATTVIEVGIDVPNASVMVIENAERFGLAQLHQLRGRVGRGAEQSYCILVTKDHFRYNLRSKGGDKEFEKAASIIRLRTMERTNDGFEISETDLKLRGPGDILGTRQSGLPEFKFLKLSEDEKIINHAKGVARKIIESDPRLAKKENKPLRDYLTKHYFAGINYFDVG